VGNFRAELNSDSPKLEKKFTQEAFGTLENTKRAFLYKDEITYVHSSLKCSCQLNCSTKSERISRGVV
jgi:hypothetical protein